MNSEKEKISFDTRSIVVMGILIAAEIVLSRFVSIAAWNIKIGLSFIPVAIAAIALGPVKGGIVGALADFLGAVLFPIGAYFPGFTITAFLTGITFGILLHKRRSTLRILIAVGINQIILSLLLNTLWISILYGSPYMPLFVTRLFQCAVMIPVQLVFTSIICSHKMSTIFSFQH